MDKLRIGICGAGKIVDRFCIGATQSQQVQLRAIASHQPERAQAYARKYGIEHVFADYQALFASDIDLVYIATYNPSHYALIMRALKAKKHVLCEKPMVFSMEELETVFNVARANGVFLMEAQKAVFQKSMIQIKQWLDQGLIGPVRLVKASYGKANPFPENHWVLDKHYGGAMQDVGVYPLSVCHYLFGSARYLDANVIGPEGYDCYKQVVMVQDQTLIQCEGSFSYDLSNTLEIFGDLGSICSADFWKSNQACLTIRGAEPAVFKEEVVSEFTGYIDHACECIKKGLCESPVMNFEASQFALTMSRR